MRALAETLVGVLVTGGESAGSTRGSPWLWQRPRARDESGAGRKMEIPLDGVVQSQAMAIIGSVPITRHRLKRSPTADKRLWIPQPLVASYPNNSSRCRGPELDDGSTCALLGALQFEPGPHFQRAKTGACLITGTLSKFPDSPEFSGKNSTH